VCRKAKTFSDLTSDKASLQEDVGRKAKQVSDLTSDKASLQEDVGRKAQTISDLTSDKASLQRDVDTKAKQVADLTQEFALSQKDVGTKAKQITLLNDQKASLQKILDSLRLPAPIRTEEIKQGYFESQEFLVLKFDVITQQDIVFEVICDIYCEAHIKDPHGEMVKDFRLESPDKRIRDETYSFKDAKITGPYSVYLKNPFTCWNECPYKVTRVAYTKYK